LVCRCECGTFSRCGGRILRLGLSLINWFLELECKIIAEISFSGHREWILLTYFCRRIIITTGENGFSVLPFSKHIKVIKSFLIGVIMQSLDVFKITIPVLDNLR
jgi:hypothetical protein